MNHDELVARILQFIGEEVQEKSVPITMDTPVEQVRMDSIDLIHVIFKAEEEFKVEIDIDTATKYETVGDFVRPLIEQISQNEKT